MKKTRTYIFDALVNLIAQSVLFFIGMFVWINPVYEVIWALAAAGFAAFLAFMERGAAEYKTWSSGTLIYVYNPLYPIGIAVGTIWITLAFIAINRLTRREA